MLRRLINETLYKSDSIKAHELMRSDPAVFADVCHLLATALPPLIQSRLCSTTPASATRWNHGPRTQCRTTSRRFLRIRKRRSLQILGVATLPSHALYFRRGLQFCRSTWFRIAHM